MQRPGSTMVAQELITMNDIAPRTAARKRPASNIDAALDLSRRGFHVFPIADGTKDRPLCRWSREATTDEATIRNWWLARPCANIGIATGPSGLLIVDVDNKNGKDGNSSLVDLELMWGRLPATLSAATASKGRHLYLRGSTRNSVCRLGPGIDVRSVGGYVVAPGSRVDGRGEYRWECDVPVADAPEWLIEQASAPKRAEYAPEAGAGKVSPSQLSLILAELGPAEFRDHDRWLDLMMASHHATAGLGADEFIAWSTSDPPYTADADLIRYRWDTLSISPDGRRPITERTLFDAVIKKLGYVPNCDPSEDFEPWEEPLEPASGPTRQSRFLTFDEIMSMPRPEWIVRGMVPARSVGSIYGPSTGGKSFLALHIALCVSVGAACYGRPTKSGDTFYIAAEDPNGFRPRISAWCRHHGVERTPGFFLQDGSTVLDRPGEADKLAADIRARSDAPRLVIIDTLSANFAGKENTDDVRAFIQACFRVRELTGATVVFIHHTGKDGERGLRGHSSLLADIDFVLRMDGSATDAHSKVIAEKQRNAPLGSPLHLIKTVVTLDPNDEEFPDSLVLEETDARHPERDFTGEPDNDVYATAARLGDGAKMMELVAALGGAKSTTEGRIRKAFKISGGNEGEPVQWGDTKIHLERENPLNKRSGLVVRVTKEASEGSH